MEGPTATSGADRAGWRASDVGGEFDLAGEKYFWTGIMAPAVFVTAGRAKCWPGPPGLQPTLRDWQVLGAADPALKRRAIVRRPGGTIRVRLPPQG